MIFGEDRLSSAVGSTKRRPGPITGKVSVIMAAGHVAFFSVDVSSFR
jgi:hypothetical protein